MDEEELDMMAKTEYYQSIFNNQIHYAVNEEKVIIAKKLLKRNRPLDEIVEDTELDEATIRRIKEEIDSMEFA